jgi:hypothetical protein
VIAHDETGGLFLSLALFAAVQESAFGTKQTSQSRSAMSAFGGKADIAISESSQRKGWRAQTTDRKQ